MITVNATFFIFDSSLNVSAWCPLLGVLWNFKYYPKKSTTVWLAVGKILRKHTYWDKRCSAQNFFFLGFY